ncbi:DUF1249 domain-containing protein [Halochromatium sp.]
MALCEENYAALMRLAPALAQLDGQLCSTPEGRAELSLSILEQSPYTTTLRLTHVLRGEPPAQTGHQHPSEPDAILRAYHDAEQVEVLNLRQTVLPILSHYQAPALAAKWRANLFVSKWLGYCLHQGYRFPLSAGSATAADTRELLPSA